MPLSRQTIMVNAYGPFETGQRVIDSGISTSVVIERRSRMERVSSSTRATADLVIQLTKIGGAVSIISGTALLVAYLHSVGAPFPSLEASIGALLTLLTAIFALFFIVIGVYLFMPIWLKATVSMEARKVYPELFSKNPFTRSCGSAYLRYFGPFLLMVLACLLTIMLGTLYPRATKFGIFLLITGLFAGVARLFASVRGRCKKTEAMAICFGALVPSWLSFIWVVLAALITIEITAQKLPSLGEPSLLLIAFLVFSVLVFLHFIASTIHIISPIQAGALCTLLLSVLTAVYPGLPYLGGQSLRFLGAGGGAPASILVRTMKPGDTQVTAKQVAGCLIFALGSDVIIEPVKVDKQCELTPKAFSLFDKHDPPRVYERLERYSRSDILEFFEFTNPQRR